MKQKKFVIPAIVLALAMAVAVFLVRPTKPQPFHPDPALQSALDSITQDYRKIIVLVDGADALDDSVRQRSIAGGRILFWRKHHAQEDVTANLSGQYRDAARVRFQRGADGVRQLVQYLGPGSQLHDADKLAFLDVMEELESAVPVSATNRGKLVDAVRATADNLRSIQLVYREEVTRIFSQFATRGAAPTREKWDAYVADLRKQFTRDQILAEFGDTLSMTTEEESGGMRGAPLKGNETFGTDFAPKSVALTFDDGPHPKYTEQVLALLRKYGIRAVFFEVGSNLGTVDAAGHAALSKTGEISKKVLADGHTIANHTYSHPMLPKLAEADRAREIDRTSLLLQQVSGQKPVLFRPPYGARNQAVLKEVNDDGLRSVMWTIDSEDWADPVPESIAMRVLHELNQKQKGIVLFHDIHKQGVLALSPVIEELQRQNYTFLAYDKGQFVKSAAPLSAARAPEPEPVNAAPADAGSASAGAAEPTKFYRESWAVIVGINDYDNWPKLRYAVNDANGVEDVLVNKYGFKHENIRKMLNQDATRQHILQVLGDEFTDGKKVQREDRVFFFFAGHGATRTMDDGRQLGFIVPVDADKTSYYSTAISMTTLREAADLIPAKHIYFVMDSCYSGLALTRGSGLFSRDHTYLEEVTRRTARQILTAGGADQEVADDGPNGHSVFTWALLEGLQGKADLDGNGVITASELGAYISPIVSEFAKQTPTVGNLVGSEGGEFLFELKPEPLTSLTKQMDGQSIKLTAELSALEKEIAAKQSELLKLQQSIQSESARLVQVTRSAPAAKPPATSKAYALDREGQQLYREKKYDQAVQKMQQAVGMKPNDPLLLNNLGFVYYVMGRYDDALSYLQKTLAIDPKRKEAHGNLADVYRKMGRNGDAKKEYEQYLALYPASPRADEVRRLIATL